MDCIDEDAPYLFPYLWPLPRAEVILRAPESIVDVEGRAYHAVSKADCTSLDLPEGFDWKWCALPTSVIAGSNAPEVTPLSPITRTALTPLTPLTTLTTLTPLPQVGELIRFDTGDAFLVTDYAWQLPTKRRVCILAYR